MNRRATHCVRQSDSCHDIARPVLVLVNAIPRDQRDQATAEQRNGPRVSLQGYSFRDRRYVSDVGRWQRVPVAICREWMKPTRISGDVRAFTSEDGLER